MSRVGLFSLLWLALILLGVLATAWQGSSQATQYEQSPAEKARELLRPVPLPNGEMGLLDAGGYPIPLRPYARIASGGSVVDALLLDLCEPERIAALTAYGHEHQRQPHLYGKRLLTSGARDAERLRELGVDLLILHHLGSPAELARLREMGIQVFNLGDMRGTSTLIPNMRAMALLLGDSERAEVSIERLRMRLEAVARDIPVEKRKRALYVSAYGGQLFGGGGNTSYHEFLAYAGLIDVAADIRDFPQYDPELILAMDPDVVVTHTESQDVVCKTSKLSVLRACQDGEKGIVGIPGALAGDPGPGLLDAAELLRTRVYGPKN